MANVTNVMQCDGRLVTLQCDHPLSPEGVGHSSDGANHGANVTTTGGGAMEPPPRTARSWAENAEVALEDVDYEKAVACALVAIALALTEDREHDTD